MRIISGYLKGRIFDSPKSKQTHPMGDKIRGAIFNILGDIEDLDILDVFAGSGAVGFEAISRGAATATLIESDRSAQKTIAKNIHKLDIASKTTLVSLSADTWLNKSNTTYDIVFADPPYSDLPTETLQRMAGRTKPEGIIVLSLPPGAMIDLPPAYQHLSTKIYGDAQIQLFRRHELEEVDR